MTIRSQKYWFRILLPLIPLIIYGFYNPTNSLLEFSVILGLIAVPFVLETENHFGGYRFAISAFLFGLGLLFFRSNAMFYFAAVSLLLFAADNWWGRINFLSPLLFIIISPVISTMVYLWSFPIRLKLSQLAAGGLHFIGYDIVANGNMLEMNGHSFSVDPACMGLKMLVTSFVLGIVMLRYFEKKYNTRLSFVQAIMMLIVVLVAAVFSNFVRLLALILFHILPENPLHEVVGLLSLVVYVLIPFYYLTKFILKNKRTDAQSNHEANTIATQHSIGILKKLVYAALLLFLLWNAQQFTRKHISAIDPIAGIELAGFEKSITDLGILKLQNDSALIYVKSPVRFFQSSHDPRFCWQGGGYSFTSVQLEIIGERDCYTAILQKGNEQLYTAWWYQSEDKSVSKEWDWRWNNLSAGEDFYLVNVSCLSREELEDWVVFDYPIFK